MCSVCACFGKQGGSQVRFTTHWVSYWPVFIVCSGSFYCCSVFHNPLIRLPSATWDVTQCEELCTVLFYYFLPLCSLLACVVAWELPCRAEATQSPTASVSFLKNHCPRSPAPCLGSYCFRNLNPHPRSWRVGMRANLTLLISFWLTTEIVFIVFSSVLQNLIFINLTVFLNVVEETYLCESRPCMLSSLSASRLTFPWVIFAKLLCPFL